MNLRPRGYCRAYPIEPTDEQISPFETRLLQDNISLILERQALILARADYFYCPLAVAHCSVGVMGGSILYSALRLGQLLIGWRHGTLADNCSQCGDRVLVTAFGGNLKNPSSWWHGLCTRCRRWLRGRSPIETKRRRVEIMGRVVKRTPEYLEEIELCAGYSFSWSGDGLAPATSSRLVLRHLYQPVHFDVLIHELKTNKLRASQPPIVGLSQEDFRRKFGQQNAIESPLDHRTIVI